IVRVPPAEVVTLLLNSLVRPEQIASLGICRWAAEPGSPGLEEMFGQITGFGSWLVNPSRTLTLVHAVQRPLEPPAFQKWEAKRERIGQTTAKLIGAIAVHGKSTVKLDLMAEWDEYTGLGIAAGVLSLPGAKQPKHANFPAGEARPQVRVGGAHVCELP